MIEPEMAFYEIEDNMDQGRVYKISGTYALDHCKDDINFLNNMIDKELISALKVLLILSLFVDSPYPKVWKF